MRIINPWSEDFHMHSLNFSDWMCSIDEIVQFAWKIWLTKIVITDHSQELLNNWNMWMKNLRRVLKRRKNVHNNVDVRFGVECDVMDDYWNVCRDIQWIKSDFNVLSLHKSVFKWNIKNVTQTWINCIKKYHKNISLIWHPCKTSSSEYLDIGLFTKIVNEYKIPLELNCANLVNWRTDIQRLNKMLWIANEIYVNSDAHTLWELQNVRNEWFKYLQKLKN